MKRLTATTVLCLLLFSAAFVTGKGPSAAPEYPDSLRSVWLYTEGVKQNAIAGDSVRARELFLEAIRNDSTYAPPTTNSRRTACTPRPTRPWNWPGRLSARHDEQVVSPVLRTGAHLCRALRRGAEGLSPPANGEPERPRQLPHSGGPLRAEAKSRHGPRDTRFGRTALRAHSRVERHETASAGGDEPDRQSRGRSPGDGRSRPL